MKYKYWLIITLLTIGWCFPINARSLDNSKVFSGPVPADVYTASYPIGTWKSGQEVRKYRGDDGKDVFLIGMHYASNQSKDYLMIGKDQLTSYLLFLNQLGKEASAFADNPENKDKYAEFSSFLKNMKLNDEEILVINKDFQPQFLRACIRREPFMSYSSTPSLSLTYCMDETFEVPGIYVTSDGEILQLFGSPDSVKTLVDIIRTSMLSNEATLNPDMYRRLAVYEEAPIYGPQSSGYLRAILGFGAGKNARLYIEGQDQYIDGAAYSSFIWLRKTDRDPFLKWLKYLYKQYIKIYKKGPQKNRDNDWIEYEKPENLNLGGWMVGNFDVDMTIIDGKAFSPESDFHASSSFHSETGLPNLYIFLGDCRLKFGSPSELEKVIKALESNW